MVDPPDYPTDLAASIPLRDGRTVELRPIAPWDDPAYRVFAQNLSPESIYLRFFTPRNKLTEREIDHFIHVDYHDRLALVAVAGVRIVGVGRYDRPRGTNQAEIAFIVSDDYQGQGIATAMLRLLARAARRHGITHFVASVLPDNHRMLQIFTDSGWVVNRHFDSGAIEIELALRPDPTPPEPEPVPTRQDGQPLRGNE